MAAGRMVLRKAWKSDHPPQFNRSKKRLAAAALGGRLRPRMSFGLWKIKTFQPERYAELEKLARGDEKQADKELEQHATAEARSTFEEVAS